MRNILKYVNKYWYLAILAPLFMIVEVLMDFMLSQYMEKTVDYGIQASNLDNVIKYGMMMLLIVFIGVTAGILAGVFTNICAYKFSNDLRKDLFKKIMNLSLAQAHDFKTGSLITRVTNDITQIQNMVSMALRGLIRNLSFCIFGVIFTLMISKDFGIVLIILLPIEIIATFIFIKLVFPIFKIIQQKLDKVNTVMHENVDGARVVKAFGKESYEYDRFKKSNDDYTEQNLYVSKKSAFFIPFVTLLIYCAQMIIFYLGGTSIINEFKNPTNGDFLMIGEVTQAISYIVMISTSVIMLGNLFTNIAKALASTTRINEILNAKIEIDDGNITDEDLKEHGTLEFKNVSFRYKNNKSNKLKNINFKINEGETVAIVGTTGSGKSTLVDLIIRFYDPTEGEILVDGYNIKDFKKSVLRDKISLCLQKSELFLGTIEDNIKFGKLDANNEEVLEAANIAQATEFIELKENKFEENVGEKGSQLSGGQKQRISIARAIIKKPEILIFDDSTSALDLKTEALLYEALNKKYPNTTKLIVAQRIATAKNASKIIVLNDGVIEAFDTHENLMKNSSLYKEIYSSQLKVVD